MTQFLSFVFLITIALGVVLYSGVDVPYFSFWLGQLPGDVVIYRDNATIYLPFTSSVLVSLVLSFLNSVVSKN